jgi:hypothetical protein
MLNASPLLLPCVHLCCKEVIVPMQSNIIALGPWLLCYQPGAFWRLPLQSVLALFRHCLLHLDDDENLTRPCSQLHRKWVGFHFINVPCEQNTASLQSKGVPDSLRWQQNRHPQKSGNALKHTKTPDWHAPLGPCKTWPRYLGSRCFNCCHV